MNFLNDYIKHVVCCLFLLTVFPLLAGAQSVPKEDPARLTVDRLFHKSDFSAKGVSAKWRANSSGYTTLESSADAPGGRDIVAYDAATGDRRVLVSAALLIPEGETRPLNIDAYEFSANEARVLIYTNSRRVWRRNTRGDYWVLDRTSRTLRQIGGDAPASSLMFAKFSPQADRVGYVFRNDIYVQDLSSGRITPITESGSKTTINGTFDWVYEEELGLRDGFQFSPDGNWIAFWQIDTTDVPEFTMINNTADLYPRLIQFAYPKAGETNAIGRIGVAQVNAPKNTRWMKIEGDPRNHYVAIMQWHGSGHLILQQLNRLQNTNRILSANIADGTTTVLSVDRNPAWVEPFDDLTFLPNRPDYFLFLSEESGWQHLYEVNAGNTRRDLMPTFQQDVVQVDHIDLAGGWIYFTATRGLPTDRYLQRISLDGKKLEDVTPTDKTGWNAYQISPNGKFALYTHSSMKQPPVVSLIELAEHKVVRALEDNSKLNERLEKLNRPPSEFFRVSVKDGTELDAWALLPPDLDKSKKYPLLIYVYGEPAGSTVTNRWGGERQLWHEMMAQLGYVVMSIDNRGTKVPRGTAWRKSIYRRVGILAPIDQAQAIRAILKDRPYLDADRVGVWGWSGGGSMTLNAMFKYPDLYKTGISIAPVPNQRLYDTIYQERYMGLPGDNVDGFREGSAINFASQLKGNLLLIHGTGDDNCHYQGTEMLINELIRHNKSFQMMAYPNRTHSIREGRNTTRHLRQLMTDYLLRNLPPERE